MKFAAARPYADPEAAARKLIEIANSVEAVYDGRIYMAANRGRFTSIPAAEVQGIAATR
jgi:hypothetical protein